jgi:hypothetical protein
VLDDGYVVGREFVVSGRDTPTLLDLVENRPIKFRARCRYGLKQIGSLRFRFGGMFAPAPCWWASFQDAPVVNTGMPLGLFGKERPDSSPCKVTSHR